MRAKRVWNTLTNRECAVLCSLQLSCRSNLRSLVITFVPTTKSHRPFPHYQQQHFCLSSPLRPFDLARYCHAQSQREGKRWEVNSWITRGQTLVLGVIGGLMLKQSVSEKAGNQGSRKFMVSFGLTIATLEQRLVRQIWPPPHTPVSEKWYRAPVNAYFGQWCNKCLT